MRMFGVYDVSPSRTSVEKEMEHITTAKQLYTRVKQLRRILKSERPDAWNPTERNGVTMPKYMADELRYMVRDANERRKELRESLYPGFDDMPPQVQGAKMANKNIAPLHDEAYTDAEDMEQLFSELYPNIDEKVELYLSVWEEVNGDAEVERIIRRFQEEEPEKFVEIMESDYDEVEINYIYPDKNYIASHQGSRFKKNPSDLTPMTVRHNRVVKFWQDMEGEYLD